MKKMNNKCNKIVNNNYNYNRLILFKRSTKGLNPVC